jgi:tetratricopeptide (TPR) repeat protein
MYCSECGNKIEDDSKFCGHCGHPVESDTEKETTIKRDKPIPSSKLTDNQSIVQPSEKKNNLWKWIVGAIVLCVGVIIVFSFIMYRMNQPFYVHFDKGTEYLELGQYQNAIEEYDKAIRLKPNNAGTYYDRGMAYHHLGQYQSAIEDYSKAIELDPKNAEVYNTRGYAFHSLGQYQRAIDNYDESIRLQSNLDIAYVRRGNSYDKLNQIDKARQDYDKAISLNPNDSLAYYNYACLYALQNNAAEACKWLQLAIGKKDNYGLNIKMSLQEDKDFDNIRNTECFINILEKMGIYTRNYSGISDAFEKNAEFKKSFLAVLKEAGISKPSWISNGVQTPLKPITIGDNIYLKGFVCKPRDCNENNIIFLYLESQKRVVGVFNTSSRTPIWFGSPGESEQAILNE